jgi:hypothetical protein
MKNFSFISKLSVALLYRSSLMFLYVFSQNHIILLYTGSLGQNETLFADWILSAMPCKRQVLCEPSQF